MITLLAEKCQKKIAWTMYFIFCSDIVVSAKIPLRNISDVNLYDYSYHTNNVITRKEPGKALLPNTTESQPESKNDLFVKIPTKTTEVKGSIGGPGQPEMQSFQSVNANNLVDLFSGDFSYNIPLMDVGGYPVGISYKSGITMDQEASWVGLGWNINPGTISRNVRGLPDDFNGTEKIKKNINIKKSWTAGLNASASPEIFGLNFLNLNLGATYNNYTGVGIEMGASVDLKKMMSSKTTGAKDTKVDSNFSGGFNPTIGLSLSSQQGMGLSASLGYNYESKNNQEKGGSSLTANYNSRSGLKDLQLVSDMSYDKERRKSLSFDNTASISFAKPTYTPTMTVPFTNLGFSLNLKAGGEIYGFHINGSITGTYNQQYIAASDKSQEFAAYGYMYYQNANTNRDALLDFNREKDLVYRTATPHIGIPIYTHDTYTISGEGIGGMFRPYRGDVGVVRDHRMKTKSFSGNLSLDLGEGNLTIVGGTIALNYSTVENTAWTSSNMIARNTQFGNSDTTHEAVYFRNPNEQTSNTSDFYSRLGGDDVVRVKLGGDRSNPYASSVLERFDKQKEKGSLYVSKTLEKDHRDKRAQVISYLTTSEAQQHAIDRFIKSYKINSFPKGKCSNNYDTIFRYDGLEGLRKPNHISEIVVLNPDGKRYVYGIPAYNLSKKEVTFAVGKSNDGNNNTGLVSYSGADNTENNTKGNDNYFTSETTPGYAHSYLLTALLSPDYVDLTNDGITEDDIGDAIKFNYSRMKWNGDSSFKWRVPYDSNKATYAEGFKTDRNDDKGNYVYGEKEVWYMNSIESKSMIATFTLNTTDRQDAYESAGENGGRGTKSLKSLKEINLYSKADFIKNGTKARPIKTVHFAYSYALCPGVRSSSTGGGKLTLDSLWFTYNNNNRAIKNKYRFNYHSNNPSYNNKSYDRWGNYKPQTNNPSNIPNVDYPYVVENKDSADLNAGAWNLTQIVLPSGAKMNVNYESDDYGFVQNKRAADMFKVYGLGSNSNPANATPRLYTPGTLDDYKYVFISVPKTVSSKADVRRLYLDGIDKIFFQLLVKMPSDNTGSGYERVPFFAEYEDYGVASSNMIWIKLKEFGRYQSFPAIAAIQMLKQNFPSKAYPGSNVGDNDAFKQVILALIGTMRQFKDAIVGFNKSKRLEGVCSSVDTSRSFIRMNNPFYSKLGGGLRVKKITISDNWNKMTSQKEAVYGQEYKYTVDTIVGIDTLHISSGVASYEPSIGNEENPFYLPIEFVEKVTLAPKEYFSSFYPLGESFFPAPSVGYSSVTVSSINKKNLKSFNGWETTEYYTTKDFPTVTDYTTFDGDSRKRWKLNLSILAPINLQRTTLSQGFKVELNDMNGKMKSQKSFAANDSVHPISYTYNIYKTKRDNEHGNTLSNTVPIMSGPSGIIDPNGTINKDVEMLTDSREQESASYGVTIPFNVDAFLASIVPIIVPTFFPKFSLGNDLYRSIVAVKLIQRYGILDSVIHYEKGSLVSTKNLVYDGETGEAIITRTQNEFNDPIYTFNYPSHWKYSGMEGAYKNIGAVFTGVNIRGGKITNKSIDAFFESGDEVAVTARQLNPLYYTDTCAAPDWLNGIHAKKLWVVDINKAVQGATTRNLFFLDNKGNPYYATKATLKIIRSGKRNLMNASVGSFTSLRNPIEIISSSQWQVKADSTVGILNTGASTFKDNWSVDNVFNSVKTCTGEVDPSCDSLTSILNGFQFNYGLPVSPKIGYNASGCDTTSYFCSYLPAGVKFKDMFTKPGIVSLPTSVEDTIYRLDCVYYFGQQRCINNLRGGFTLETQVKAPPTDEVYSQWKGLIFMMQTDRGGTAYTTDYIYFGHNLSGRYNNVIIIPELNLNLNNSYKLKFVYGNDSIKVYVDGVFKWGISKPGNISTLYDYNWLYQYVKGQIDWVKIYDNYGHLVLSDDFNSGCSAFSLPKAKNRCTSTDCQTAFTTYFNSKTGGSYTFSQIDSIYKVNCRYFYNPCLDSITYIQDSCTTECKSIFTNRFNPYTQGMWGNWRTDKSYVFYDTRKQNLTSVSTDIRRDGEFKKFVSYWNFNSDKLTPSNYNKWVWNAEITRFNKKGVEIENKDPLGRYNSGLYGYNQTLPIAVAQNAKYRQIAFEGFEDYSFTNDSCGQTCPPARQMDWSGFSNQFSQTEKHSGKYSLKVDSAHSVSLDFKVVPFTADTLTPTILTRTHLATCNRLDSIYATNDNVATPVFSPIQGDSLLIGLWVKEARDCKCDSFVNNNVSVTFYDSSNANIGSYILKANGGIIEGWQRYEDYLVVPIHAAKATLSLSNVSSGASATSVFFDDLRIHPFNSNMKTYVYNAVTLRLMAELDENNYATFYEYDDEGTLVRVKKETQLGIKTIKETRSTLLK